MESRVAARRTFSSAAHQPPCRQMRSTAPGKAPCPGKAFQFPRSQAKAASADGIARPHSRRHSPAQPVNRRAADALDRARQNPLPRQSLSIPPLAAESSSGRWNRASPLAETFSSAAHQPPCRQMPRPRPAKRLAPAKPFNSPARSRKQLRRMESRVVARGDILQRGSSTAVPPMPRPRPAKRPSRKVSSFGGWNHASPLAGRFIARVFPFISLQRSIT